MLLVIDFDGTLCVQDTVDWVAAHYAPESFAAADAAFSSGEITLDECLLRQMAPIVASIDEIAAFMIATVELRDGVPELLAFCAEHAIEPMIVSSGFVNLMEPYLASQGVDLPISGHRLEETPDGLQVVFRGRAACGLCGVACKRHEVLELGAGRRIAYVGDGASDLCAAEAAELRFARATLADHLDREGYPFVDFDDFHDVRRGLEQELGVAP